MIKHTLDEKKREKLTKELVSDLKRQDATVSYTLILRASEPADLNAWSKEVAIAAADVYKAEKEMKASRMSKSWTEYFWGSNSTQSTAEVAVKAEP